jgi:hypothetical protein
VNARIQAPSVKPPWQPCDYELEAEAIGVALLGYPLPDWLEPRDFHSGQLRAVFRAVSALGERACLPAVNAYLRDVASGPFEPAAMSAVELATIMQETDWSLRQGWAVDFERLRELADQRALLAAMAKVELMFEHEGGGVREAREMLKGAMGEC